MKKSLLIGIALLVPLFAFAGDLPDELVGALNSGNAKSFAAYFNNTIELTIVNKDGIYSKAQAEIIIRDFFVQNPPRQFTLLHQGGKESSKYAIGNLSSDSKTYRITIYFKIDGSQLLIHQLRIENEYGE
jgi:hypothetical protein